MGKLLLIPLFAAPSIGSATPPLPPLKGIPVSYTHLDVYKRQGQASYVDSPDKDIHEESDKVAADLNPLDTVGAQAAELLAQMENNERDFRQDQEVAITLDAFTAIAQFLMPLPGRKNLLWLSGSFPLAVLPETSDSNADQSQRNYSADQKKVADLLNLSHTAVYAVDVRGLMNNPAFSASSRVDLGQHGGGGGIYNTAGPVSYTHLDVYKRQPYSSRSLFHETLRARASLFRSPEYRVNMSICCSR